MNGALVTRANALRLPLRDESVDLVVTSPPYFALRSYRDHAFVMGPDGTVVEERLHYPGQIGSEAHPQEWLEALWAVMAECWRVLKPTGSCFVNLGDKRSGSGGGNDNTGLGFKRGQQTHHADNRGNPRRYNQAAFGRAKSKMLLPHRFAIGCEDGLADPEGKGWIVRQDVVWSKLNGLPESVTDRCRDSHEYLFHLVKQPNYFAAVDEVRESYAPGTAERYAYAYSDTTGNRQDGSKGHGMMRAIANGEGGPTSTNPLGKLPGSVWPIASEPLIVSDEVKAYYDLPDHFAAFPTELVRRCILGWSPSGACVACGEGRHPVVEKELQVTGMMTRTRSARKGLVDEGNGSGKSSMRLTGSAAPSGSYEATITGYSCACPDVSAPTRQSVVLDIFGGTGTTAGVARALGRMGISVDLSMDYSRLAAWRIWRSGHFAKVIRRTNAELQAVML